MSCLSAPCSAETVPPTAHWLAALSSLSEWCVGVLFPLSECPSLSLQFCFGAAELPSSLPQSKLVAFVVAVLVDEVWIVVAVGEVRFLAAAHGFPVEDVQFLLAVLGLVVEDLAPVSSGCPLPARSPLHFEPAACSLHTEDLLSAQLVCC